jgi:hypothetical protein
MEESNLKHAESVSTHVDREKLELGGRMVCLDRPLRGTFAVYRAGSGVVIETGAPRFAVTSAERARSAQYV